MSHAATKWAFEQELPAMQKLTLLCLAHRHNRLTDRCFPSIARMERDTGAKADALRRALRELRRLGLIAVGARHRGSYRLSNEYTLCLDCRAPAENERVGAENKGGVAQNVEIPAQNDHTSRTKRVHLPRKACTPPAQNGSNQEENQEIKPGNKPKASAATALSLGVTIGTLPLNTGEEFVITDMMLAEWQALYPAVDVKQQLRSMKGWCQANLRNRKTKAGIPRFIVGWLGREQNKGGRVHAVSEGHISPAAGRQRRSEDAIATALRSLYGEGVGNADGPGEGELSEPGDRTGDGGGVAGSMDGDGAGLRSGSVPRRPETVHALEPIPATAWRH